MSRRKPRSQPRPIFEAIRKHQWAIALIIAAAGLIIASLSLRVARDVAQNPRPFEKSELYLEFATVKLPLGQRVRVFYGLDNPGNLAVCYLPLKVANVGAKTLRNPFLTIRLPRHVSIPEGFLTKELIGFTNVGNQVARKSFTTGPFAYSGISLPDLHPQQGIAINEPFVCGETRIEGQATTKNRWSVSYVVAYAYETQFSVIAEDTRPSEYTLSISVGPAESFDELVARVLGMLDVMERAFRNQSSFPRYLGLLLGGAEEPVILIQPRMKLLKADEMDLLVDERGGKVGRFSHKLHRWRYLFGTGNGHR